MLSFVSPITFRAFGLKSANDHPERDPSTIEVYVFDEKLYNWVMIFRVYGIKFERRWETKIFRTPTANTKGVIFKIKAEKSEKEI